MLSVKKNTFTLTTWVNQSSDRKLKKTPRKRVTTGLRITHFLECHFNLCGYIIQLWLIFRKVAY